MDRPVFREDSIIQDREDSEEVDGVEDEVDRFVLEDDDDEAAEKEEARVGKGERLVSLCPFPLLSAAAAILGQTTHAIDMDPTELLARKDGSSLI